MGLIRLYAPGQKRSALCIKRPNMSAPDLHPTSAATVILTNDARLTCIQSSNVQISNTYRQVRFSEEVTPAIMYYFAVDH